MTKNPSVLFRCDGSPEIGLGHVVRCLALAGELRNAQGCKVSFAMRQGTLGVKMAQAEGYRVFEPADEIKSSNQVLWLKNVVKETCCQVLILDVRDDLPSDAVSSLRCQGILIVTIDDPSQRRLHADLAFYPPVPQIRKMSWSGFSGRLYDGWEWVILRRQFEQPTPRVSLGRRQLLVTMGGSDPFKLTLRAVEALDLLKLEFDTSVVLGPGFLHNEELQSLLVRVHRQFDIYRNVSCISHLMARADMAVASFGVTAYELAATGVPAIFMSISEDHEESLKSFVDAGIALSIGIFNKVTPGILAQSVKDVLTNPLLRSKMSLQAKRLVDGSGAARIAQRIIEVVKGYG